MILKVRARGMATRLFTQPTGAELGLTTHSRSSVNYIGEMPIGTKEDGAFAFTNVPAGRIWLVYPKMDSLAARNLGAGTTPCETKDDGEMVDIGDLPLKAAHTLRGRIVLTDGKPVPPGMRITLSADVDSQVAPLAGDGSFEFRGWSPATSPAW